MLFIGNFEFPLLSFVIGLICIVGIYLLLNSLFDSSDKKLAKNIERQFLSEIKSANNEINVTKDLVKQKILKSYISCLELNKKANEKEIIIKALNDKISKRDRPKYRESLVKYKKELTDLEDQLNAVQFNADEELTNFEKDSFKDLCDSFENLISSEKKWLISNSSANHEKKSSATILIGRKEIEFYTGIFAFIKSDYEIPILKDDHGYSYYLYPKFVIKASEPTKFEIISLTTIIIQEYKTRFIEEQEVPSDSIVLNYTYQYVNKNGRPDKRYTYNPRHAVLAYSEINFPSLYLKYQISNTDAASSFASKFEYHCNALEGKFNKTDSERNKIQNIILNRKSTILTTNEFSQEYYKLLKELSPSIYTLLTKLQNDKIILSYFNAIGVNEDLKTAIKYWVIYDLIKVAHYVSDENLLSNNLIGIGLTLVAGSLSQDAAEQTLNADYETIKKAYDLGIYDDFIKSLQEINSKGNPLKALLSKQSQDVGSSVQQDESLALPSLLQSIDDPLFGEYATLLFRFANIISKADNTVTDREKELLLKVYDLTHKPSTNYKDLRQDVSSEKPSCVEQNETLEDVISELNALIGLDEVKDQIKSFMNFITVQKTREKSGLKSTSLSYHVVFTGSPGTGKTTVARILAKIYKHLDILKTGQLVETDRSGLIAEYSGQTAIKVNKTVDSALDGVLFIDEAYALVGKNHDDFGKEAVATLIKRMENDRDKLVLIMAGYTDEMNDFIDTNPGIKSRFNRYINFPDYHPNDLYEIFQSYCQKSEYHLSDDATEKLKNIFEEAYSKRNKSFGNGRFARNIFEATIERQANRISQETKLTKEILTTIIADDIL